MTTEAIKRCLTSWVREMAIGISAAIVVTNIGVEVWLSVLALAYGLGALGLLAIVCIAGVTHERAA